MTVSEQKRTLYNATNNPEYDIDEFSQQMETIVDSQLEELIKLKGSQLVFNYLVASYVVERMFVCAEELANIRLKIKQEEETAQQIATKKQSGKK